uniref:methionine--tRNA ligase n=1 Tax=Oryza punctata TaxID=4537 RepID=A0A0E0M7E6_ORYPU
MAKAAKQAAVVLPVEGRRNVLVTSALPYVNNVPHLGNIIGCSPRTTTASVYKRWRPTKIRRVTVAVVKSASRSAAARAELDRAAAMAKAAKEAAVVLPVEGRRNVLVTSALPYVNNVPHLGNIIGCVLSGDAFARYCRLRGHNVLYVCGTDEYGTATETKAMEEGCSPREICDKYHAIHKEVYEWFDISFDIFGRTSSPQQTEVCQGIFLKLLENNWLSENTMQQVCGSTPCVRDTDHLFLELPLLREKLEKYIDETSVAGSWSQNAIHATNAWLKEGLKPRCITRDLKWGVPVPHEKYKDKVFYVWFDAPIGYISITSCYTPEWEKWWKNPENVELYQFMGKDNVPFHTVMFPSTLLGTGENWTLMKTISVTEYLNYESGKFSKTKGIGVFGNDAKSTNIPPEVWRYYLLTNRPEASDTLFTWTDLQAKCNNELLNNLGNFINRVLSFIAKPEETGYGSVVPDSPDVDSHTLTQSLAETIGKLIDQYIDAMDKVKIKHGLKIVMAISSEGNAYLQESQFWKLYKQDLGSCATVMKTSVGLVYLLACLLEPFMPTFSRDVLQQLNLCPQEHLSFCDEKGEIEKAKRPWDLIPSGHRIGKPAPLFKGLENDAVKGLREKFAGSQAERKLRTQVAAKLEATNI